MKKKLLSFCFSLFILDVSAQVNKTWVGINGANWNVAANWTPIGVPGPSDTVVLSSNSSCNVDINPTIAAIRALGVNSNQLANNTGVLKTITISSNPVSSPVLYVQAGSFFTLGGTLGSSGVSITTYGAAGTTNTAQINGSMNFSYNSEWNVANGTAVTIVDITNGGGIGATPTHSANLFLNSSTTNLRFQAGSYLSWARNGGSIPAADYQDGSLINVTGVTSIMPVFSNAATYSGRLIWNNTGQTASGASAVLLPTSSYSMDSISVISTNAAGGGSLRIATEPTGYTLGYLEVTGGTVEMSAPVLANRTGTIISELRISGGTVYGNATFVGEGTTGYAMTLSILGKLTIFGSGTFNLTNRPIGLLPAAACQVNVAGDVLKVGGTLTASSSFGSQNQLVLNGTSPQNLSMASFSGPMSLVINNSSATGVTLLNSLTISAAPTALIFASGILNTTAHLLIMTSGSQVFGASNSSFVDGPVKKIGNTSFTFPIGKTTCGPSGNVKGYVPITISNFLGTVTASDEFTAEYKRGDALGLGAISNGGIDHVSRCDYWTLLRGGATASTVDITAYWDQTINGCVNTSAYVNDLATLTIAHNSNPGTWDNFAPVGSYGGGNVAGNITWTGTQSGTFGAFALASVSFTTNPLPINLNYLTGIKQNGAHYLNWKVTCFNNASATMVLERSADGRNFTSINTVTADALRCQQPFDHTDNSPLAGMNYYRLKMIDANGKITYSTTIALLNKESGFDIVNLVPTLVTGNAVLNVTAAQKTKMDVVITDISGRQVQKIAYNLIAGSNQFTVNLANLSAGTYQIKGYTVDGASRTIRFVKQ